MLITVHQPQYLPWLGYIDKIDKAEVFVILDTVQFKKNEWQNRNRIKTAQGWQWITVPVLFKFPEKIHEVGIDNTTNWKKKHLHALVTNYSQSSHFASHKPFFEDIYNRSWERIADLNLEIIKYLIKALRLETELVMASSLRLREGQSERLIDICKTLHCDKYLAGIGGSGYMNLEAFEREGIEVVFQDFNHPVYNQLYGTFEPGMSVIDLLFNCGEKSMDILRGF